MSRFKVVAFFMIPTVGACVSSQVDPQPDVGATVVTLTYQADEVVTTPALAAVPVGGVIDFETTQGELTLTFDNPGSVAGKGVNDMGDVIQSIAGVARVTRERSGLSPYHCSLTLPNGDVEGWTPGGDEQAGGILCTPIDPPRPGCGDECLESCPKPTPKQLL
jgi:hypothetical protein